MTIDSFTNEVCEVRIVEMKGSKEASP